MKTYRPEWLAVVLLAAPLASTQAGPIGGIGVLDDSYSDEYQFYPPNRAVARNWVEILAETRELNFGRFDTRSRGEPRNQGHEYNWARSGATTDNLIHVTDAGLVHLKSLTNLQALDLSFPRVTEAGIAELRRALPGTVITPHPARAAPGTMAPRGGAVGDGNGAGSSGCLAQLTSKPLPSGSPRGFEDRLVVSSEGTELSSISPRVKGKVPIVFIHGMLGTPANWSFMIDRLSADRSIGERFQLLTFGYNSLQSIPESGRELRDALVEARRRCDPEGRDDSFDRVVLVGHSLGGLVAKAAAARAFGPRPAADGPPSGTPPMVRVGRIIFIATPHRGSAPDSGVVRSVGACLTRVVSPSMFARKAAGVENALWPPTSIDEVTWDHSLLKDLEHARADAGVPCHSIIAALNDPSAKGATDGIVPVASARLGGARSEVVVRTHHLCLKHPDVVREVRRVLLEHSASLALPARVRSSDRGVLPERSGDQTSRSAERTDEDGQLALFRRHP